MLLHTNVVLSSCAAVATDQHGRVTEGGCLRVNKKGAGRLARGLKFLNVHVLVGAVYVSPIYTRRFFCALSLAQPALSRPSPAGCLSTGPKLEVFVLTWLKKLYWQLNGLTLHDPIALLLVQS